MSNIEKTLTAHLLKVRDVFGEAIKQACAYQEGKTAQEKDAEWMKKLNSAKKGVRLMEAQKVRYEISKLAEGLPCFSPDTTDWSAETCECPVCTFRRNLNA